ncbi:MAG TPA: DUF4241 domain-containing protein [Tepidisphaeraceae bacterium]|jgi:hypothetical protein
MKISTEHEQLPDASDFAEILAPDLSAHATFNDRTLHFKAICLPKLKLRSGQIIASDPYILNGIPFTTRVPIGDHRLTLAIALINTDERIAFAQVRFSTGLVTRWSMALVAGQDVSTLKPNYIFGYGVDSGTGCFADSEAYAEVTDASAEDLSDRMMDESQKVYRHTRDWLTVETAKGSMALFSSGYGDGLYASYFGYSEKDELISLVTDFGLAKSNLIL